MKYVACLAIFFCLNAQAQLRCLDKLVPLARPSGTHQLVANEWQPQNAGVLNEIDAHRATVFLVHSKLLCQANEIQLDANAYCSLIDANHPNLVTCSLQSNVGYFTLTQDWAKNANFVFTKNPPQIEN